MSVNASHPEPWPTGRVPVTVVMITLNEGHNISEVLANVRGWAEKVLIVDSYSRDGTVSAAIAGGAEIVQRRFRGFGDQWNFAINDLPINTNWTMKLDPDERLSDELKASIECAIADPACGAISFRRRWWLLGGPLPINDVVLRVWRTGECVFSDQLVNEHPVTKSKARLVNGYMEHLDSPDLDHWIEKQNRYSTAEAVTYVQDRNPVSLAQALRGERWQRRMWIKRNIYRLPFWGSFLFLYFFAFRGLWMAGPRGAVAAGLWRDCHRWRWMKIREMQRTGRAHVKPVHGHGLPDPRTHDYG